MNKEEILLEELNRVGNFTTVTQEFNSDQLGVIYACMDAIKLLKSDCVSVALPDERDVILEALNRYANPSASFGKPISIKNGYKEEGWLECYGWIKGSDRQ